MSFLTLDRTWERVLGAGRARSVLFNEDEMKHARQEQQQQLKKHTHKERLGWPNREMKLMQGLFSLISDSTR